MTIEIVDFRMNSMVIFHSYVSLPEGNFQGFFTRNQSWRPIIVLYSHI